MSFVKSIPVSEESVSAVMQRYPDQGLPMAQLTEIIMRTGVCQFSAKERELIGAFAADHPRARRPQGFRVLGRTLLLWPVIPHDVQHLKEHLPVTDVVGHEQDQFAIETIAFVCTQALMQFYEPGIEIILIQDAWFGTQFLTHTASPDLSPHIAWWRGRPHPG